MDCTPELLERRGWITKKGQNAGALPEGKALAERLSFGGEGLAHGVGRLAYLPVH